GTWWVVIGTPGCSLAYWSASCWSILRPSVSAAAHDMKVRVTGAPLVAAPDAAGVAPDGADAVVAAGAIAGAPVPGVPGGEEAAEHAATSAPAPAATDINRCRRESVRVA